MSPRRAAALLLALSCALSMPDLAQAAPAPGPAPSTVTVTPRQATAAAGEFVLFDVAVSDGDGTLESLVVEFGDGTTWSVAGAALCPAPPARPVRPLSKQYTLRHAYRLGGAYAITIRATTASCSSDVREEAVSAAPLIISHRLTPSNGPESVELLAGQGSPSRPKAGDPVFVDVYGRDADGFVRSVTIDWGDGRLWNRMFALEKCDDPIRHWPSSSLSPLRIAHQFPKKAEYAVKVTVTATGCDGRAVQRKALRFTVRPLDGSDSGRSGVRGTATIVS